MKVCRTFFLTVLLGLLCHGLAMAEQTHFVFGSAQTEGTFTYKFQSSVLKEAFKRMGYTIEIKVFTEKDKLIPLVQNGELDGDGSRVKEFGDTHPGYVRVDTPTFSLEQNVYATKGYPIDGWDSIYALNLNTGYIVGEFVTETKLLGTMDAAKLHGFTTRIEGFDALASGKIDLFVMTNQYTAAELMTFARFQKAGIRPIFTLRRGDAYVYFAEKHRALAPKLARILHEMQREALFERFIRDAMSY